jgi:chromosome segregation ATPase
MFNSIRNAMSMRGGDTGAELAHERLTNEDVCSPTLTDVDTLSAGTIDHGQKLAPEDALKKDMLRTFEEKRDHDSNLSHLTERIVELKKQLISMYERAGAEKKRADKAEEAKSSADPYELRTARQQTAQAIEEKDAALLELQQSKQEAEQAKEEAECLRGGLQTTRAVNQKLVLELEEARNARPTANQTVIDRLHTTITARDAKIEQLGDKNDKLTDKYDKLAAEHFTTLKQINKDGEETNALRAKCENQDVELKELRARLAKVETR